MIESILCKKCGKDFNDEFNVLQYGRFDFLLADMAGEGWTFKVDYHAFGCEVDIFCKDCKEV